MALNKGKLRDDILAVFETAKDEEWGTEEVSQGLADAIDAYVRGGDVTGVETNVNVETALNDLTVPQTLVGSGTGTQNNTGRIE